MSSNKSILAYFHSYAEAESCKNKLQALRASDINISSFGEYPGHYEPSAGQPLTSGDFPGLGSVTLSAPVMGMTARVLSAADPDASGLAGTGAALSGEDDTAGRNYVMTAVVPDTAYEQTLRVMQEGGGLL